MNLPPGMEPTTVHVIGYSEVSGNHAHLELAMRRFAYIATLLVASGIPAWGQQQGQVPRPIVQKLMAALEHSHIQFPARCMTFLLEGQSNEYLDIGVHERHGGRCRGSPETAPRLMGLRYMRQTGQVLEEVLDADIEEYKPLR